jgi:hypothetical protein
MGGLVISRADCRADCRAISARRRTTAHFTVVSTVLRTGYEVNKNCLLCAYGCDFCDNYIITIVKTAPITKKYVAVLFILNLVSDFVKCNHPIVSCIDDAAAAGLHYS